MIQGQKAEKEEEKKKGQLQRGHYHQMSYETKLKIIRKFIEFKDNSPKVNGKNQSFEEFYRNLAVENL